MGTPRSQKLISIQVQNLRPPPPSTPSYCSKALYNLKQCSGGNRLKVCPPPPAAIRCPIDSSRDTFTVSWPEQNVNTVCFSGTMLLWSGESTEPSRYLGTGSLCCVQKRINIPASLETRQYSEHGATTRLLWVRDVHGIFTDPCGCRI
jgi:hypothetical protein